MDVKNRILCTFAAIAGFFIIRTYYRGKRGFKTLKERLTREYRQALDGTDRQVALSAGR